MPKLCSVQVLHHQIGNTMVMRGLKKRLGDAKGRWTEELPVILWSYHTTPHSSTGETPFKLVYGSDAMIPVELIEPSWRITTEQAVSEEQRRAELDMVHEIREMAHIKEFACKLRAERRYNSKVVPREAREGDLVLRRATKDSSTNKLSASWEGPFRVGEAVGKGAYRLEELSGKEVLRTWNMGNLRFYFS